MTPVSYHALLVPLSVGYSNFSAAVFSHLSVIEFNGQGHVTVWTENENIVTNITVLGNIKTQI